MLNCELNALVKILLEYLRKASEMSVSDLCRETKISTKTFYKLEKGEYPPLKKLEVLFYAFYHRLPHGELGEIAKEAVDQWVEEMEEKEKKEQGKQEEKKE